MERVPVSQTPPTHVNTGVSRTWLSQAPPTRTWYARCITDPGRVVSCYIYMAWVTAPQSKPYRWQGSIHEPITLRHLFLVPSQFESCNRSRDNHASLLRKLGFPHGRHTKKHRSLTAFSTKASKKINGKSSVSGAFLCADGRGENIVFDVHPANASPDCPSVEWVRRLIFFVNSDGLRDREHI